MIAGLSNCMIESSSYLFSFSLKSRSRLVFLTSQFPLSFRSFLSSFSLHVRTGSARQGAPRRASQHS